MEYTIRPAEPRDAGDISALRRMPGVFETILGNPGESRKKTEDMLAGLGPNDFMFVAAACDDAGGERVIGSISLKVNANPRTPSRGRNRPDGPSGFPESGDWPGDAGKGSGSGG